MSLSVVSDKHVRHYGIILEERAKVTYCFEVICLTARQIHPPPKKMPIQLTHSGASPEH